MSELPAAELQTPACGACRGDTWCDGDAFICEDCQLCFDLNDLSASFLDPDAQPCGAPCDNSWHGDHKIRRGEGYDCGTCKLPADHPNRMHWTGCDLRAAS